MTTRTARSGVEAIRSFLNGFLGFYTTDGYVVYKILLLSAKTF